MTNNIHAAFEHTMRRAQWFALRSQSWKKRVSKYPFRTVWCALVDRYWVTIIALTHNPLITTRTFWGAPILVRFDENRSIVHDGLIDSKELGLEAYVVKNISSKDIFFDVGANAGFYTMLAHVLGARVVAFEPMPQTFEILKKNAPNATLVNKALMDKSGSLLFADLGVGIGLNRAIIKGERLPSVEVLAITLDQYCSEQNVLPTFIKIDAEGAESYVVEGGRHIFQTYHPTVVIEGDEVIIEKMKALGYTAFQLHSDGSTVPYKNGDEIFNDNMLFTYQS